MLDLEKIKAGNKFRGLINNCLIEILKVENGYVTWKDCKGNYTSQTNLRMFIHLQLEEI